MKKVEKKFIVLVIVAILVVAVVASISVSVIKKKVTEEEGEEKGGGALKINAKITWKWDDKNGDGNVSVNETVTFDGSASTPSGVTYYWDFGDGTYNNENRSIVTHKYIKGGTYTVTLTVKYGNKSDSDSVTITVVEEKPPSVEITVLALHNNRTNVNWRVTFPVVSGTEEQLNVQNFYIRIYNLTNESGEENVTEKLPLTCLAYLTPAPYPPPLRYEDGIYFADGMQYPGTLSNDDEIIIAGDGGVNVTAGDIIEIYYRMIGSTEAPILLDSAVLG